MGSATGLLELESISAGYQGVPALWDLSLRAEPGTVTAILGRNGAGKSTTLRAIAGLIRVTQGVIRLDGQEIHNLPVDRRVQRQVVMVPEGRRLFLRRTVEENLMLGGYSNSRGLRSMRRHCGEIYERFPALRDRAKTRCGHLSGGQQQMVAIGRALMAEPAVLMLDEPSSGLAPSLVREVYKCISELRSSGISILLVEQDPVEVLKVADFIVVLDVGRNVLAGKPEDIGGPSAIREAYFGRVE